MKKSFDITLVGGGLVGMTLARALKDTPYQIALIEAFVPEFHPQAVKDMRSLALSYASQLLYKKIKLWPEIEPFATPIEKIHVSQEKSFGKVLLDSKALNLEAFGHVVPIPLLYQHLHQSLLQQQNLTLIRPAKLNNIFCENEQSPWKLCLETQNANFQEIHSTLLIAADGDHSFVREFLKLPVSKKSYHQTALVSIVKISKPHYNTAYERFTPDGVLALMPREDNHMAVIWTVHDDKVESTQQNFLAKTQQSIGYKLGQLTELGTIQSYPLSFLHADQQALPGVIILGNAAHVLHPVAAQGLNLGLRDVSDLSALISKTQDLSSPDFIQTYLDKRKKDQHSSERFTSHLVSLFDSNNPVLKSFRGIGLGVFDKLPKTLKRLFCLRRMGVM